MSTTGLDLSIMDTKEFDKLVKEVGDKAAREFIEQPSDKLKAVISTATLQKQDATDQVNANSKFVEASDTVKDFKSALRDTTKPLDLRIKLASRVLKSRKENNSIA